MKKIILIEIFVFLLLCNQSNSQYYDLKLQNHVSNYPFEFRFDIFFANNIEYAQGQYVIKFPDNTSSYLTFYSVADCSELFYYQIPETFEYDTLNKLLIIRPRNLPGAGHGTISPVGGDRVATIGILSKDTLNYNNYVEMKWQNSGNEYTRIYAYINSTLTEITDSNHHTKDFNPPLGFSANYTPILIRPVDNSIVSSFPLWLVCFYYISYTSLYRVQIATDQFFINRVIDGFYPPNSSFYDSMSIQSLEPFTTYYWRLNVHNFYAISPFSETWSFNTDSLTSINISVFENPKIFYLSQNYPNPFNPVTNLEFGISELEFVSLKIYDLLGKEIATLVNEKLSVGSYEVEFDGSNLTSGMYFYKLAAGSFSEVKRMMLLK